MKTPRKQSPARSQGSVRTPIRHRNRRTLSVSSARSQASGRLTTLIKQSRNLDVVVMSPLGIRKSILSDNTEIEEPRRNSWWKKLGENSTDVLELLNEEKIVEPNNIIEELDMEILSQEKKNYTMDIPESSDNESINSIVIPQRKLFTQKENVPQKMFGQIIGTRETLAKLHKTNTTVVEPTVNAGTRELFQNKQRSKPIFPAALLNISPNKTAADKTKELAAVEPKAQIRNIFGSRATKRKNIFTNFIVSESEDEIPEIQPKVFGFQKKIEARRRGSSSSRGLREPSPTSSMTTDIEMDDWKMLPSSTMVENQLEVMMADGQSPKRARLSKLTEIESETGSNATRHSNKSVSSKDKSRKSKTFSKEIVPETETSMTTRNKTKVSQAENGEILDDNKSTKDTDKSRKSKTFTKEKASESETSMKTRNKSKLSQNDNEDVLDNERSMKELEKYRKSKTFTKEKTLLDLETSMTTRNKSKVSQDENDETLVENKSSKALDKSRKSKTIIKEKELDFETSMTTRNKSKTYFPTSAQNKSKIPDDNLSQSSIKTRSKNNSPNTSVTQEADLNDKSTALNKSKPKSITTSPKDKSKQASEETPIETIQENDDDDLNFTLKYDDENNEEILENIQNNTKPRLAKNMSPKKTPANLSMSNKSLLYKVVEESAELESTEEKSNSIKVTDKSQINDESKAFEEDQIQENEDVGEDVANNSYSNNDRNEMEVDENKESLNECEDDLNESHKNVSESVEDNENEEDNSVESQVENNDESVVQNDTEINESQEQEEENNEDDDNNDEIQEQEESIEVQTQSEPENESQETEEDEKDNNKGQEEHNDSEEIEQEQNDSQVEQQNESEVEQNESEVYQNESEVEQNESEVKQNESEVEQNESNIEQNESQENLSLELEIENDDEDKNMSQEEIEHGTDMEQNKSEIEDKVGQNETENQDGEEQYESGIEDNEEQNESGIQDNGEQNDSDDQEQNESEDNEEQNESADNEEESEAVSDTDNDAEPNQRSQEVANKSNNRDTDEVESGQEIETPNVSHDTTGRNRKKNESPEVILQESNNHLDSFAVQGRNTSVRKTMMKSIHISPSLASQRESTGFSDGTKDSSAEGSGWDSHRTTRKTLRQTFGRDFTPRKSLRALVMEKSAKRQTQHNEMASVTAKFPQANSTELPEISNRFDEVDEIQESNHEVSIRTRQTTLENYLEKIKEKNAETRLKIEEAVRESLKAPPKDVFKVPAKPFFARRLKPAAKKPTKSTLFLGELPAEVIEDLKYKPPKRFAPSNAPWITKRLYKFLETKLEPKYDYKARLRSEKLVENIYHFAKDVRRRDVASCDAVDVLKREMARLEIVKTHFDFYEFFHQFMPREVRVKVIPDVVNNISLPRHGVFADIL